MSKILIPGELGSLEIQPNPISGSHYLTVEGSVIGRLEKFMAMVDPGYVEVWIEAFGMSANQTLLLDQNENPAVVRVTRVHNSFCVVTYDRARSNHSIVSVFNLEQGQQIVQNLRQLLP